MNAIIFRKIRQKRDIAIKDIAEALGVPTSNVSHIESGKRDLPEDKIVPASFILDCSRAWLESSPYLLNERDIVYYLLRLEEFCDYQIIESGGKVYIKFDDFLFLEEWREKRIEKGETGDDGEYERWFFSKPSTPKHEPKMGTKLKFLRESAEANGKNIVPSLIDDLGITYLTYMQIEENSRTLTREQINKLSKHYPHSPQFFSDNFCFRTLYDVELFLMTLELQFNCISLAPDGVVWIDLPVVAYALEQLRGLKRKVKDGQMSLIKYEIERRKL